METSLPAAAIRPSRHLVPADLSVVSAGIPSAHMGPMEIITDQQAWNDLPVNSYAVVTSRSAGRIDSLFVSRCAEDRGVVCGDHMIAGGKHWTDLFAHSETTGVIYRNSEATPEIERTTIPMVTVVQGSPELLDPTDSNGFVARAVKSGGVLPDSAALWIAVDLGSVAESPALVALHSTGSAPTADLLRELTELESRYGVGGSRSGADRLSALRHWIASRR